MQASQLWGGAAAPSKRPGSGVKSSRGKPSAGPGKPSRSSAGIVWVVTAAERTQRQHGKQMCLVCNIVVHTWRLCMRLHYQRGSRRISNSCEPKGAQSHGHRVMPWLTMRLRQKLLNVPSWGLFRPCTLAHSLTRRTRTSKRLSMVTRWRSTWDLKRAVLPPTLTSQSRPAQCQGC